MKVFLSWSGDRSSQVARALSDWLPSVIQAVKPWMSEQIVKGMRWGPEMARALEETRFGIVCLTPDNLTAPWILFETGALSKTIASTHVCPYLLGLKPADLQGPLAQFQAAKADVTDTLELVKSINVAQGETILPVKFIESAFNKWWPELEKELQVISQQFVSTAIPPKTPPDRTARTEMEVLEEILEIVRQLSRDTRQPVDLLLGRASEKRLSEVLADYFKEQQAESQPDNTLIRDALRIFGKPK
jgi:TIR domain